MSCETLAERSLRLAVPATHPLAAHDSVDVADLRGQRWIAGPSAGEELLMGVWPGLDERPVIAHTARDWLAKLQLVAAGLRADHRVRLAGVRRARRASGSVTVRGGPQEQRRIILARLPHPLTEPVARLAAALRAAAIDVGHTGVALRDDLYELVLPGMADARRTGRARRGGSARWRTARRCCRRSSSRGTSRVRPITSG